jgi:hypothetical protein
MWWYKTKINHTAGQAIIAQFTAAATNLSAAFTAKAYATKAESDTLRMLEQLQSSNGLYVTAEDIPDSQKSQLVATSLDSHLKKVQSEQIEMSVYQQTVNDQKELDTFLKGKYVTLEAIATNEPFQTVWQNAQNGALTTHRIKAKSIKGYVEEVSLENNYMLIRTTSMSRLLQPRRLFYVAHVIQPATLMPMISMSISD